MISSLVLAAALLSQAVPIVAEKVPGLPPDTRLPDPEHEKLLAAEQQAREQAAQRRASKTKRLQDRARKLASMRDRAEAERQWVNRQLEVLAVEEQRYRDSVVPRTLFLYKDLQGRIIGVYAENKLGDKVGTYVGVVPTPPQIVSVNR